MSVPKPTIVLVPGAWHKPEAFKPLTSLLEAAGYTCIGVSLPSIGAKTPLEGIEEDVEAIKAAIMPEVEADRDVVVLMHSYGSVPAGEAVKGLDKATRRKDGGRGGVAHLFYCCAFAAPKGASLIDMLGGKPLPWFDISEDGKTVNPSDPTQVFYADVPSALQKSSVTDLLPHSYRTMFSKTSWEPWRDIPSTYLYCTEDQALPYEVQKGMIEGAGGKRVWKEETVKGASHSPFLSQPEVVAAAVRGAAGEEVV